jgi:hypothetical protein
MTRIQKGRTLDPATGSRSICSYTMQNDHAVRLSGTDYLFYSILRVHARLGKVRQLGCLNRLALGYTYWRPIPLQLPPPSMKKGKHTIFFIRNFEPWVQYCVAQFPDIFNFVTMLLNSYAFNTLMNKIIEQSAAYIRLHPTIHYFCDITIQFIDCSHTEPVRWLWWQGTGQQTAYIARGCIAALPRFKFAVPYTVMI